MIRTRSLGLMDLHLAIDVAGVSCLPLDLGVVSDVSETCKHGGKRLIYVQRSLHIPITEAAPDLSESTLYSTYSS